MAVYYPYMTFSEVPKGRNRRYDLSYQDPEYIHYFDTDSSDLYMLMCKMKEGKRLDCFENDRWGEYILAAINANFYYRDAYWKKSIERKCEIAEFAITWILDRAVRFFKPGHPGKTAAYLLAVAKSGCARSCFKAWRARNKQEKILRHLEKCLEDYFSETSDGKVRQEYAE